MKRVLVTGFGGQLGYDVIEKLKAGNTDCKGVDLADFDITDEKAVKYYVRNYAPSVVVHCSAYTAVDKAESEQELCYKVNRNGSENLARACKDINAELVLISTDYVFGGTGEHVMEITEPAAPLSIYGKSKFAGEEVCKAILEKLYIVRTSWVFGKNGNNFVKTMLRLGRERKALSVVADQIGSPTYTVDLADFLCYLIDTKRYGVYHYTNEGFCSWYEFAKEIFLQAAISVELKDTPTAEYKTAAVRPLNSRLSKRSVYDAGFKTVPHWKDALGRFLKELGL